MQTLACLVTLFATTVLGAQTPPPPAPSIEAVSIKPTPGTTTGASFGSRPGGGIVAVNMPMRSLISLAYELPSSDAIEKAPDWFVRERYDVNAVVSGKPTPEQSRELWRAVFADRFKLKAHVEMREVPAFTMVLARPGQPLPRGLKKIETSCASLTEARQRGETPPTPPLAANGMPHCSMRMGIGTVDSAGMTMERFAGSIQGLTGRVLVDKTGLQGDYEFTLTYSGTRPGAADASALGDDRPSIFTALQEQLGLKLEPTRTQVEYLVIDHIERPTAN
jgi:uncharacterized protein (TIGR03435 family)